MQIFQQFFHYSTLPQTCNYIPVFTNHTIGESHIGAGTNAGAHGLVRIQRNRIHQGPVLNLIGNIAVVGYFDGTFFLINDLYGYTIRE